MLTDNQAVRFILGQKLRAIRLEKGLSYVALSERTGLSVSFLNEIEKGKKYPKSDKLLALAKALSVTYDELVSLKPDNQSEGLHLLLNSSFFKAFPLEFFGLEPQKLLELAGGSNTRVNAFIHAILDMVRKYDVTREHFFFSALQAYQELNHNYFESIEEQVRIFKSKHKVGSAIPAERSVWYGLLENVYNIAIQKKQMPQMPSLRDTRSYLNPKTRVFHLNSGLSYSQVGFLLCRELGFQYMQLHERPYQTPPTTVLTFEEALNNFYASYFAVALLMDEQAMIRDIRMFSKLRKWQPEVLIGFLRKYEATPEMLMQRLTNLLPRHFGVRQLFFLRFVGRPVQGEYHLTKELHLAGHHAPHANFLSEHYCRRWIAIRSMEHLHQSQGKGLLHVAAQFSTYVDTPYTYFCISIAKANESEPGEYISVTIGFLADASLKSKLKMTADDSIPTEVVHTTCERCPLSDCKERVAPARVLYHSKQAQAVEEALEGLL